jgi:DNA-binding transcriptional MocR family regulator
MGDYTGRMQGNMKQHITSLAEVYRPECDRLLDVCAGTMLGGDEWTIPYGGLFLRLKFPREENTAVVLDFLFIFFDNGNDSIDHRVVFSRKETIYLLHSVLWNTQEFFHRSPPWFALFFLVRLYFSTTASKASRSCFSTL